MHQIEEKSKQELNRESYHTTFSVEQSSEDVFNAINNVKGWWSEEIEGKTDAKDEIFDYHYEDVHYCKIKIIEFVPNKKVVWSILDNYFKFTQDKTEWIGNKIMFEIDEKNGETMVQFTHEGLGPQYECYEVCNTAWTGYIQGSLRELITTGKGKPNQKEFNDSLVESKNKSLANNSFTTSFIIEKKPEDVFKAITNVKEWWTGEPGIQGNADKLGDEFTYTVKEIHYSKLKIIQLIPSKKIVWFVLDSKLDFIKDKTEWNGTKIIFEIIYENNKTKVQFTHVGLVPDIECYSECSKAWNYYITDKLLKYLNN